MDSPNINSLNKIKSNNINIYSIKCKYILKQIFNNLSQRNLLKMIKYSKAIQNELNISINDYKKFSQIEIELIPAENQYGEFIHINNKEDEKYYHIYFNNNTEEIKELIY